ncbi:MAG TPA: PQQ-binding-like beta-propeller repeat protein, partial [archaeon]|nr:PQQ-binding-like beta-propeller repeat protein [archaeon]
MGYYIEPTPLASQHIDAGQFADVQLAGSVLEYKEAKRQFFHNIGIGGSFLGAALVLGGRVYIGCADRNFYALSPQGAELWRLTANGVVPYQAVAADGLLYFGSFDGRLYAVRQDGSVAWTFQANDKILTSPALAPGRVVFGSKDGNVYCVDATSGREL